jgi:DNA invertase Pin-like site-specific DNA recombinase
VSTHDQNLEMQLDALKKTGCKRIFTDKLGGAQVERPGLKEALSQLREADTLVVWKLDRLGRSVKGLVDRSSSVLPVMPKKQTRRRACGH